MKRLGVLLVAVFALGACQQSVTVRSTASSGYIQLEGSQLVLARALEVPAGRARVFLQNGRPGSGFDHYRPHCGFEVRRVDHDGFTIEPDTFRVTRVQSSVQQVVQREPVMVASRLALGGLGGYGSSAYHEGYHFWLQSDRQPDVMRMSCFGVYAVPIDLYPPTFEEIDAALGDNAHIRR